MRRGMTTGRNGSETGGAARSKNLTHAHSAPRALLNGQSPSMRPRNTLTIESIEKPRACRNRACFPRSADDVGNAVKRLDQTWRARSTSLPDIEASVFALMSAATPNRFKSWRMRASPKRSDRFRATAAAKRSSESSCVLSSLSSTRTISAGSSSSPGYRRSFCANSARLWSRRARSAMARLSKLLVGLVRRAVAAAGSTIPAACRSRVGMANARCGRPAVTQR